MPLHPGWSDLAFRLVLTVLAGAVIGWNRGLHGHVAGLRTTILVALAASVAMIQANLLLAVGGKTAASFSVMDVMRLPLGILTGVGFIGAGSILRRGDLVTGVTTAATLWAVTVIGLCFGGGQIWLGIVSTALGVATLTVLKWLELRIAREHRAVLAIRVDATNRPPVTEVASLLEPLGYGVRLLRSSEEGPNEGTLCVTYEIRWRRATTSDPPAGLLDLIAHHFTLISFGLAAEDE